MEALAFFPTATFSPPVVFFPTGEEVFWGAVFWADCLDGGDFLAIFFNGEVAEEEEDGEVVWRGDDRCCCFEEEEEEEDCFALVPAM